METSNGMVTMILALHNSTHQTSYIAYYQLNKFRDEWKAIQEIVNFNENAKMSIIDTLTDEHYLVVSSHSNRSIENDNVFIYKYDSQNDVFRPNQKPFAGAKYDIILSINVKPKSKTMKARTFLLFARTGGREVKIYRLQDGSDEFIFQRMVDDFRSTIVEVLVLYLNDMPFFIVSQQSGVFCLYEWRGIESWQKKYCGHFNNIRHIKSVEYLNRQHLFLAANAMSNEIPGVNALAIYQQGGFRRL
jgi:hypothetical protein